MRIKRRTSSHGIQRLYYLTIFTSLLALVIYAVGCGPSGTNSGTSQPSPSPKAGPHTRGLGETPIVISGGSIQLDFPTGDGGFQPQRDGTWLYTGNFIDQGLIYNNNTGGMPASIDLELPSTAGNSEIIIYRTDGALKPVITITSASDGGANMIVRIAIGQDELQPRPGKPGHYFGTSKIAQVTVTNKKTGAVKPITNANGLPAEGKLSMYLFGK